MVCGVTFVVMEPIAYALHRWVMHGFGISLHRSHHRNALRTHSPRLELNDLFPVLFAVAVITLLAIGFNVSRTEVLVPIGVGATAYGLVYAFVHDVVVHRRAKVEIGQRSRVLGWLAEAHRAHHATNGEPYGMLAPYVLRMVSRGLRPSQPPSAP